MNPLVAIARRSNAFALPRARAYAEGNMTARVLVTRGQTPVFDPSTGEAAMGGGRTVYEGVGRVYDVVGPVQVGAGDEPTYYSSTSVSIPISAERPQIDDQVQILEHLDSTVVGRFFRVTDVEAGGQLPVVHLMRTLGIQPSPQWGAQ